MKVEIELPDPSRVKEGYEAIGFVIVQDGDLVWHRTYWTEATADTIGNYRIVARRKPLTGLAFIESLEPGTVIDTKYNERYCRQTNCLIALGGGTETPTWAIIKNGRWEWKTPFYCNTTPQESNLSTETCTIYPPPEGE
jgi:hypothetical protein